MFTPTQIGKVSLMAIPAAHNTPTCVEGSSDDEDLILGGIRRRIAGEWSDLCSLIESIPDEWMPLT